MYYILGVLILILFALANIHYTKRRTDLYKQPLSGEKLFIIFASLLLFLVFALQSEWNNIDLIHYSDAFNHYKGYSWVNFKYIMPHIKDPFYHLCGMLFAKMGFSFQGWRLLLGFIYTLSIYLLISRYSSNVYISFIVIISIGSLGFALSGLRQTMAFAVLMLSFKFLKNKKIFKFACMVLLASLFHSTAIIFLLAYPLYHLKLRPRNLILLSLGCIVVIINARFLIARFISFIRTDDVYNSYIDKESSLTIAGVIIFGVILIFCLFSYYLGGEDAKYQGLCNLAVVSFTFRILSATMLAEMFRVSMYFAVFDIIMIAEACSCGKRNVFLQRTKTVGATLAMAAYYFISPSGAITNYIFK